MLTAFGALAVTFMMVMYALEHRAIRRHREDSGHDRDPVFAGEVGAFPHIDADERIGSAGESRVPERPLAEWRRAVGRAKGWQPSNHARKRG